MRTHGMISWNECTFINTIWDGIKGLQLLCCGKLNITYHGKLRCRSRLYCGCHSTRPGLLRHPHVLQLVFIPHVLRLMYCSSYKFEGSITAVHEPQYTRDKKYLLYCGTSWTAAAAVWVLLYGPIQFMSGHLNILSSCYELDKGSR